MSAPDHHAERVRTYFDAHAQDWSDSYQRIRSANDLVLGERLRLALELTADGEPAADVLDAGCGAGPLTIELARRGARVVGVDISPRMIDLCRRSLDAAGIARDAVTLRCGDVREMDLATASFDFVFALGFLQYQHDEHEALCRLRELLRPGGSLVISGPIRRRLGNVFGLWDHVRSLRRRLSRATRSATHKEIDELLAISPHLYSKGRFERLLEAANLVPRESTGHGYVNYVLVGPMLGVKGELALHRFFTAVSKVVPLDRFANDLVVLARRPPDEPPNEPPDSEARDSSRRNPDSAGTDKRN